MTVGSDSAFVLPSGARRSPDAAWLSRDKLRELSPESLETYWRLCPEFVIELLSKADILAVLRGKMDEWISNGAQLGWLIDPESQTVEVYRPERDPEIVSGDVIGGEGPVDGFVLRLSRVWEPLARHNKV